MSLRRSARLGSIPTTKPPTISSKARVAKPRKATKPKAQPKPEASYWSPEPLAAEKETDQKPTPTNPPHFRPSTPPPLDRPVDPHRTNATLLTPHGSAVNAYPAHIEDASPTKTGLPRHLATTGTILDQATAHLIATDPRLATIISQHPCPLFSPAGLAEEIDPFNSLTSSIIGQQVSGAAAKSIRNKFLALFDLPDAVAPDGHRHPKFPTPDRVAKCDIPTLRSAGLSQRKAEYIQGLAEKFANGELGARMLASATDEELFDKLIAVRGLGKWSVEMFAIFALKRIDVFSTGDLGVQ
jgi:DNA-3-methyladenine glycosylase II